LKAILFDFGGTIDTNGIHWSEKFWDAYVRTGIRVSKDDFESAYVAAEPGMYLNRITRNDGLSYVLACQVILQFSQLRHTCPDIKDLYWYDNCFKMASSCYDDVVSTINDLRPMLEGLSNEYSLGLVSNFYGNLEAVCRELGIDTLFDTIIDSAVIGIRKPNPQIFAHALDSLGICAQDAIVVGDSYDRDIIPAKTLGCTTVWLRGRSWRGNDDISSADHIISSLKDLPQTILKRKK
jgi:putative hydrolase of the HAD superfamily